MKNQDVVLKLAVSTLDYSRDGLARVILSKILTAATDVRPGLGMMGGWIQWAFIWVMME